jgi:3-oxoacyl-[acyl-carrier-protein] synthase-3
LPFDQAIREGKIKRGDVVILVSFGAGLTWGANVIRF